MRIKEKIRNWIKSFFGLYEIKDLQIGGHCCCCGTWISDIIVSKIWAISLCENCKEVVE